MAHLSQSRRMATPQPRSPWTSLLAESKGSAIVEFAVSLPLLVVLVVGIFDFGSAFTVKQKLAYATRRELASLRTSPRPISP